MTKSHKGKSIAKINKRKEAVEIHDWIEHILSRHATYKKTDMKSLAPNKCLQ